MFAARFRNALKKSSVILNYRFHSHDTTYINYQENGANVITHLCILYYEKKSKAALYTVMAPESEREPAQSLLSRGVTSSGQISPLLEEEALFHNTRKSGQKK
jgi:hypothetical protein